MYYTYYVPTQKCFLFFLSNPLSSKRKDSFFIPSLFWYSRWLSDTTKYLLCGVLHQMNHVRCRGQYFIELELRCRHQRNFNSTFNNRRSNRMTGCIVHNNRANNKIIELYCLKYICYRHCNWYSGQNRAGWSKFPNGFRDEHKYLDRIYKKQICSYFH